MQRSCPSSFKQRRITSTCGLDRIFSTFCLNGIERFHRRKHSRRLSGLFFEYLFDYFRGIFHHCPAEAALSQFFRKIRPGDIHAVSMEQFAAFGGSLSLAKSMGELLDKLIGSVP